MNKPNFELINKFLCEECPEMFDMKKQWIDIEDTLERELYFKRKCCMVPDPDECELTMSIMCILLKGKGFHVTGYEGRHVILEDGAKIETDTANSFISLYKGALMTYLPTYHELLKKHGIKGSFMKAYEKIYANREEFTLKNCDKQLHDLFCKFAVLTHSIGNFVLGPVGFNCADQKSKAKLYSSKNWSTFDRMDLFLKKVAEGETYKEWIEWYSKHMKDTYTDFYYSNLVYADDKIINLAQSKVIDLGSEDLHIRLAVINAVIIERGKAMVKDLRKYMSDNIWNK